MRNFCFLLIVFLFQLSVSAQPAIESQSFYIKKCIDNSGLLGVTVADSCAQPLTFQWKKNGTDIPGETNDTLYFPQLAVADEGDYVCMVTNIYGTISSDTAVVEVAPSLPSVTLQPLPQTICSGENAVLSILASGSYLSYKWTRNDTLIPNALSNIYAVGPATGADNGWYVCTVKNHCGSVDCDSVLLTVKLPAAIYYEPEPQVVCAGDSAVFRVYTTGTANSYQWKKDGTLLAGETSDILVVYNVDISDEGNYSCAVWNSCDSVNSIDVGLLMRTPPEITAQPYDTSACTQDTVSFYTTAVGTPPILYHWYFNGLPTSYNTNIMTVENTIPSYEGYIYCYISNVCASIRTDSVWLHIKLPPSIVTQPEGRIRCLGDSVTFSVKASGEEPLFYQWRWQGSDIMNATIGNYLIAGVNEGDEGIYTCMVTNMCGNILTDTAILIVNTPPQVVTQPSNNTICEFSGLSLSLEALGTVPLTYEWVHNGFPLSGSDSSVLIIDSVLTPDAGTYTCYISNVCGIDSANQVSVIVNALPRVTTDPQDQMKCTGDDVLFSITATGAAPLYFRWLKNGVQMGTETDSTLAFTGLTSFHEGAYSCMVYNMCGDTTSQVATLTINEPPVVFSVIHNQVRCEGDTVSFGVTGYGELLLYQWFQDGAAITGEIAQVIYFDSVSVSDQGLYHCEVTNYCGNAVSDSAGLTVNPGPVVDLGNDVALCQGDSVILTAGDFMMYQWNDSMAYTPSVIVDTSGTFIIEVWNSFSCYGTDTVSVQVNVVLPLDLGDDTSSCGDYTVFPGVTAASYNWNNGLATTPSLTVTQTGTYTLVISAQGGCVSYDTINVEIKPVPAFQLPADTSISTDDTLIIQGPAGFASYFWNNSVTTQNLTLYGNSLSTGLHSFALTVWNEYNCSATDDILIDITLGVDRLSADNTISIYPNPVSEKIILNVSNIKQNDFMLEIINQAGQVVSGKKINKFTGDKISFDLSSFQKGAYLIKLTLPEKVVVKKFVVQ